MEEHDSMIRCPCAESDRLLSFCISCGKVHAPDPSWFVLAFSTFFLVAQAGRFLL